MVNVLAAIEMVPGRSAFASMSDAPIATGDQFDQAEGLKAVASSAVVESYYTDKPVRGHHASHTGKGSSRPLRSQRLERPLFRARG
jgi:hypothetical protein